MFWWAVSSAVHKSCFAAKSAQEVALQSLLKIRHSITTCGTRGKRTVIRDPDGETEGRVHSKRHTLCCPTTSEDKIVYSCCKEPHLKARWRACHHTEGWHDNNWSARIKAVIYMRPLQEICLYAQKVAEMFKEWKNTLLIHIVKLWMGGGVITVLVHFTFKGI